MSHVMLRDQHEFLNISRRVLFFMKNVQEKNQ